MSASIKNLVSDSAFTFDLTVIYEAPDGTPIDLTGWSASFATQNHVYPATVDNTGTITVNVTDEETSAWQVGDSSYRLSLESPTGAVYALLKGRLTVRGNG